MILALLVFLALQDPNLTALDCSQAMTTVEINECVGRDLDLEQQRMGDYLDATVNRLTEEAMEGGESLDQADAVIAEVREGQTLWQAYADKACDAVYTRWQAGTIRVVMALECHIELTRQRTHHLWSEYLSFPDSTEPLRPEPVKTVAEEREAAGLN